MKSLLLAVICMLWMTACIQPSFGYQNVGDDFGSAWLENYGTSPMSTFQVSDGLWNWGNSPKGFVLRNGTLYPPGTAPQWFYPQSYTDYAYRHQSERYKRRPNGGLLWHGPLAFGPALGKACDCGQ